MTAIRTHLRHIEDAERNTDMYRTLLAEMCSACRLTDRDLTILAAVRSAQHIDWKQHLSILAEMGISMEQWEHMISITHTSGASGVSDAITTKERDGNSVNECVVCLSHVATFVLLPCGHLCLCVDCRERVTTGTPCPKCRCISTQIQRVFT